MEYVAALKRAIDDAGPATGFSRQELERRIAMIGDDLKGPMSNADRISLCAVRASYRKALAKLP